MSEDRNLHVFGFNTTRLYQRDGQRITVGWRATGPDDLEVWFNDHGRGIWGKLKDEVVRADGFYLPFLQNQGDGRLARRVMGAYDRGQYSMDLDGVAQGLSAGEWPEFRI